jgi:hypothetical protein
MEFAMLSNPLKNSAGDGADRLPTSAMAGDNLTMSVGLPVSGLAGGYGSEGITYVVQDSNDLVNWRDLARKSPLAATWTTLTIPAITVQTAAPANGRVAVSLSAPSEAGITKKYLRLQISLGN